MPLRLFNKVSLPYSHPLANLSLPPVLTTQALERMKRYFEEYKSRCRLTRG